MSAFIKIVYTILNLSIKIFIANSYFYDPL